MRPTLKLGTWNVRTLMTGLAANLKDMNGNRKTVIINNELKRLGVDIASLLETRLAGAVTPREDYALYWQGKSSDEHRADRVGFAVTNTLLKMMEPGSNGSARLHTLRLNTTQGPVTFVSVYALTLTAIPEAKDEFYENQLSGSYSFSLETSMPE